MQRILLLLTLINTVAIGWLIYQDKQPAGKAGWIQGTTNEKLNQMSQHLRGFDMAMVETGYRFSELYFAGLGQNWDYAKYQVKKLRLAINNGLERRPGRKNSAEMVFPVIGIVEETIKKKDHGAFLESMDTLVTTCNTCHGAEGVSSFHVEVPRRHSSPLSH